MKKILRTLISLLTSAAFLSPACAVQSFADYFDTVEVYQDLSDESLTLADSADFSLTAYQGADVLSNYSEDAHVYKYLLDDNNLAVYEAFAKLVEPSTDKITVSLPDPVTVTLSALPSSSSFTDEDRAAYSAAIYSACQPGIDNMLFDMPEVFWLDERLLQIGLGVYNISQSRRSGTYTLTINSLIFEPMYDVDFGDLAGVNEYKEKLEDAVKTIAEGATGETRYEKLTYIHDWICRFTYYDVEAKFSGSAVGAIVEPGVVCEGYSKAFKLVCDYLDIPCAVVFGNYDKTENVAHMWDYVQMEDGIWYAMDVTWDDLTNGYDHDYFLKGSQNFFRNHEEETMYNFSALVYPTISETDFDPSVPIVTTSKTTTSTTTTTTTSTTTTTATTTSTSTTTTDTTTTTETTTESTTESTTTATETTTESATTTTSVPEPADGDVNRDGSVNIADLVCCINAILAVDTTTYDCDCNKDGVVDIFDVIYMRVLIAKIVYNAE